MGWHLAAQQWGASHTVYTYREVEEREVLYEVSEIMIIANYIYLGFI